ncbi:GH92 family glycosyl hydrolase [Bacteroides sp. 51]|uniref:GH92 family glycosyl hydrolase n=1 Tax=Bacteroides sp. 51 TaxID=2302938 RepID=UPI0013D441A8|nr:GH92 family glycosyl hydrolase [Bacteroides sp. 51]NDV81774.1 glycoside hydrolase family 92 protein [Bacteroides sp. 51]
MKTKLKSLFLLCAFLALYSCNENQKEVKSPVDYVNPYIGNISHLLVPTYPTVHLPNSMLRVYPERADYTTDQISGLPVIVTSHRGSSAFNISPLTGTEAELTPIRKYAYDLEKIKPYHYSVYLSDDRIAVDYAPSHQSGIYRLAFEKKGDNFIVINTRNGEISLQGDGMLSGYQVINEGPTKVYLYLETEQTPVSTSTVKEGSAIAFKFKESNINLRYGVSFISSEQAKKNLQREINTYNVDQVAQVGRDIWNETLGKIKVEGDDEDAKAVFYTSLYRTYERMINLSEDGHYYSAGDGQIHNDGGIPFYNDDWIWDTYRATHPLRILIEPEMEEAMITSYTRMAQETKEGWMPTFPEVTGDSHRMNGNHAVAMVWDAYCKGLKGFDLEAAYNACRGAIRDKSLLPWVKVPNSELDDFYWEKGYYPALYPDEKEYCSAVHSFEKRQAISLTLGNSYDNWCLAEIAKALGKTDDYNYFLNASYNYRNVYNAETQFFHPKDKNGKFIEPFDYRYSGGQGTREYYGENNAWIYRWDVQHNIADLINMMNGPEKFISNLNDMFRTPLGKGKYSFYAQIPDHTGNVGQFSMANEPSLHIPYLYNYAGQPWKTQQRITMLLKQWFRNDLMGLPGDEDGGGMTAFVVFSSMGFYPVTPGFPAYNIGSPQFKESTMKLGNGNTFRIIAENYGEDNKYIQSATLNGQEWNKPWFAHSDIINGATLVLVMGDKPNYQWGAALKDVPPSIDALN